MNIECAKLEDSFVEQKLEVQLSLLPCYTHSIKQGVQDHLNRAVLRYSSSLKGVFLGFRNVALAQPYAAIFNEAPHLHCDITCDALVFKPTIGAKLSGRVNKVGMNHVGMLVSGVFNASIPSNELPKGYEYKEEDDAWVLSDNTKHDDNNEMQTIEVGNKVEFRVTAIHEANGLISIQGSMKPPKKKKRSRTSDVDRSSKKKKV